MFLMIEKYLLTCGKQHYLLQAPSLLLYQDLIYIIRINIPFYILSMILHFVIQLKK